MKTITEWLKPPKFDDDDKNTSASTLYTILQALVGVYLLFTIYTAVNQQTAQLLFLQVAGVAIVSSLYLVRKGKLKIPGYIVPGAFLLSVTIAVYNGNGIHDIAMLGFPMIIALSGLLIGKDAVIYSTFGSITCVAIIIWMEVNNMLETEYQSLTDLGDLLIISIFLLAMAAVVYSTMDIIAKNFRELKTLNDELEERVAIRTAQLESTNKDLESFAYSISHDLRAPLRSISGYSHILQDDFSENLDETGKIYLQHIRENASQMNTLIEEILTLSRTGQQGLNPRHLSSYDLQVMLREILNGLVMIEHERNFEIHLNEMPECFADPILLKQVFVNLLSNAFKFSRKNQQPVIKIGGQVKNNTCTYYVQDNGAGFDMAYADKLFGVFQRLHRQDEYEGTGVGLAIVQRIVTQHGGRIWAESAPNQGATFYFTLNTEKTHPRTEPKREHGKR